MSSFPLLTYSGKGKRGIVHHSKKYKYLTDSDEPPFVYKRG